MLAALVLSLSACALEEARQPPYYETLEVSGSPYERGYQHGEHFKSKIQSFYTMLLTNSIFPYLNRERDDVASVMLRYQDDIIYGNGTFAHKMMLESAWNLALSIPEQYMEEMQGVADGAGMAFEDVLLMNTFFDTMMGFRSITFFIKLIQGPSMLAFEFLGELESDGIDNNGDGQIDEVGEGRLDPYEPMSIAGMVEVPTDTRIRFILDDDKDGVDPTSIRIQLDDTLYTADHASIEVKPYAREGKTVEVLFTPPEGLPEASVVSVLLQCVDLNTTVNSPPNHPRSMRDERVTFTTVGYGAQPFEVGNCGVEDGRTQPPSFGFAVRGSATPDGQLRLGHHFALLDSNITHKHSALFMHHPNEGESFAFLGYTGVIWGFSGMNGQGLTYIFNTSDTLNNSFAKGFNAGLIFARMLGDGVPIGLMGREMLNRTADVGSALAYLHDTPSTFGWNLILADSSGLMKAVELDGNIMDDPDDGVHVYSSNPNDLGSRDAWGNMYGSIGPDDLRMSSHFQKNTDEIDYQIVNFNIQPQRYWSSFYFRSLRAFYNLGNQIQERYGKLDRVEIIHLLRANELIDERDSMNASVYEPQALKMYIAAGQVPATDGPFREFDLGAALDREGEK